MALTPAKKLVLGGAGVLGVAVAGQLACHVVLWTSLARIEDILRAPDDYSQSVFVGGKVGNVLCFPFVGGIYRLQDATGTIWVMTKDDAVPSGDYVAVKGYVKQRFSINDAGKWKPLLKVIDNSELAEELSEPRPVVIEKRRQGVLRAALTGVWD